MKTIDYRAGRIALVGPPNAGKSTFLNTVLGEKITIVSPKPQTTRNSITGIYTTPTEQIVFLDTPGIHAPRGKLNRFLVDAAWNALREADGAILFLDAAILAGKESLTRDLRPFSQLGQVPLVVALNKTDLVRPRSLLLPLLTACAKFWPDAALFPVCARKGEGLEPLLAAVAEFLPESAPLYPKDQLSTASVRFLASEIIREKLFLTLRQELPYSVAVEIENWEEDPERNMTLINAVILTAKESHKGMVIGKQGQLLKIIGQEARRELIDLLGTKVYLELRVKTRAGWNEDGDFMRELGLGS